MSVQNSLRNEGVEFLNPIEEPVGMVNIQNIEQISRIIEIEQVAFKNLGKEVKYRKKVLNFAVFSLFIMLVGEVYFGSKEYPVSVVGGVALATLFIGVSSICKMNKDYNQIRKDFLGEYRIVKALIESLPPNPFSTYLFVTGRRLISLEDLVIAHQEFQLEMLVNAY